MVHNVKHEIYDEIDSLKVAESRVCGMEECDSFLPKGERCLKILQQNIRSLKCNFDDLLSTLSRSNVVWDCLVLTECWLQSTPYVPLLDGYNFVATTNNHTQNEGVVVYIRKELHITFEEPQLVEANCIVIKIDSSTVALAIYRPPSYKNRSFFLQSLNELLAKYSALPNIIILGDINIDLAEHSHDPDLSPYLDMLAYHGIQPAYLYPTHGKTCLDHVLLKTNLPSQCLILQTTVTDHYSVALLVLSQPKCKPVHKINRVNIVDLDKELRSIDFNPIYDMSNVNNASEFLINTLRRLIEKNTKYIKMPRRKAIIKPWMTPGMLKCLRNRDNLHKKLKKNPNNEIIKITYKRYRNHCSTIVKRLKSDYEITKLKNSNNNNKKLWKAIKEITYTTTAKEVPMNLISTNNPTQSINNVNRYFANVGRDLAQKILNSSVNTNYSTLNASSFSHNHSFVLLATDNNEVLSIINNLKSDCATGLDLVPADLIKRNKEILVSPITYICNLAMTTGVFPTCLKKARIFPIHKAGDKDCAENYRPISILPTLAKILEHSVVGGCGLLKEPMGWNSGTSGVRSMFIVCDLKIELDSSGHLLATCPSFLHMKQVKVSVEIYIQ
ncbi:unnamed protein product [Euphydryas editha]|uniref:Endonuclease/exonuclease/phosphatase domain-containing protein n=1 Tax=Euphydryas editha TaxID=104508 RepID=A0AAU9VDD6_EUPED|nr:unnamed protein product [Euphydryas editha]